MGDGVTREVRDGDAVGQWVYDDPLHRLEVHQHIARQHELAIAETVAECRDRGVSWARIGAALGITKQGAQARYGAPAAAADSVP